MSGNNLYSPDQSALDTRWIQPWSEAFRVSQLLHRDQGETKVSAAPCRPDIEAESLGLLVPRTSQTLSLSDVIAVEHLQPMHDVKLKDIFGNLQYSQDAENV